MAKQARSLATAAVAATALLSTNDVPSSCASAFSPQHAGLSFPPSSSLPQRNPHEHRGLLRHVVAGSARLNVGGRMLVVRGVSSVNPPTPVVSSSSSSSSAEEESLVLLEEAEFDLVRKEQAGTAGNISGGLSKVASSISEKMGTVDERRAVFPEITTGEVPRLFSNLKYDKSDNGKVSASAHAAGSSLQSAALIASTAIGAGVLALPSAAAPSGFLPSTAAMAVAWAYMTISGLLLAELTLNRIGENGERTVGLWDIYEDSLGKGGCLMGLGTAASFFLQYAVVIACVARGGTYLGPMLGTMGLESVTAVPGLDQVIFAGIVGSALLFANSSAAVKSIKNVMSVGVGAALVGVLAIGAGSADFAALLSLGNQHPEQVVDALPIIFLSLGYQHVVPEVVTDLEGDRKKITAAVVAGTAVPFLVFLAWNAVILGNTMGLSNGMDPVAFLQNEASPLLGTLVGGFSLLAVTSTLVGFIPKLTGSLADALQVPSKGPEFDKWKPALFTAALLPAVALSGADPDIFRRALDFGGAFSISTLFLVLPPIMIWKSRYGEEKPITVTPMVPGGKITLGSLWKAAGTLIVEQGAEKLGIIHFVQDKFLH